MTLDIMMVHELLPHIKHKLFSRNTDNCSNDLIYLLIESKLMFSTALEVKQNFPRLLHLLE